MKTPELPTGTQAEFDAAVPFQTKPLTIAGDMEVIQDLHAQAEVYVREERTARVSRIHDKVAQVAVMEAPAVLEGRRASLTACLYDLANRTSMYDLLKQKRQDEKNLAMATRLGLISLDDVACAKHKTAIAKLHNL